METRAGIDTDRERGGERERGGGDKRTDRQTDRKTEIERQTDKTD